MSGKLVPLFASLSHGVYVIGVAGEERFREGRGSQAPLTLRRYNAFTASWVMQTSFDPPMLVLSVNPKHASYALLKEGGGFTVNVLGARQRELALHFAQAEASDKLAGVSWRKASRQGGPILGEALAWFECELTRDYPSGDHRLVLGKVIDGGLQVENAAPLQYRDLGGMDGTEALLPEHFPP